MTAGINNHALGINNRAIKVGPDSNLPPLVITTPPPADVVAGSAYSANLDVTGAVGVGRATPTPVWSATGLPAGLTIDSATGVISGTTSVAPGNYPIFVTVADGVHVPTTVGYMLVVTGSSGSPSITTASLPGAQIGVAYSKTVVASGGATPYTWSATVDGVAMPTGGLNINPSTGAITGTPTGAAGTRSVVVTVSDSNSVTAPRTFSLVVAAAPIAITTTSLPSATNGSSYSKTIATTGGSGTKTWGATGLPSGLSINSSGVISGTPNDTAQDYTVVVTVSATTTDSQTYTLTLADPGTSTAPGALPWVRRLALGNLGVNNSYVNTIADAIAAGTNRLAGGYGRLGFNWWAMDPQGDGTIATGTGSNFANQKSKFTNAAAKGFQGLPIAAYSAVAVQRILTFDGATLAGNKISWTGGVGSGIDAQMKAAGGGKYLGGHYAGGTVTGPGITGAQEIVSTTSSDLTVAGGVTAGRSGTYQLGGHGVNNNDKAWGTIIPAGVGGTTLSPFGKYVKALVTALGSLILAIELGNETNQPLGSYPFVDPVLQWKNWCHAWVGAHLANPDIIVLAPGCASTRSGSPSGRIQTADFYDAALDAANGVDTHHICGVTVPTNYFTKLCADNGLTKPNCPLVPYDGFATHVYGGDPGVAPNTNMNEAAYIWNQHKNRGGGGAPLPCFFTEQGPGWGAPGFLTNRQSFLWFKNFIDLIWGNVRWPHDAIGGLEATGVSISARRTLANTIFGPALSQCLLELDGFGDHVGLYQSDGTPKFDSYALNSASTTIASGSNNDALPSGTINVASTTGFMPTNGWLLIGPATGASRQMHVQYTGKTPTSFTGCTGGSGTLLTGMKVTPANSLLDALIHADAA